MRRKALGDITNSKSASKQQQSGGGSSQKGAKVGSRAVVNPPSKLVFPSHVEEVEGASRFAAEENFADPGLDIDLLLSSSGPIEPLSKPLASLSHKPVEFELEAAQSGEAEEEELVDMEFDDDCTFDAPDIGIDCDDE